MQSILLVERGTLHLLVHVHRTQIVLVKVAIPLSRVTFAPSWVFITPPNICLTFHKHLEGLSLNISVTAFSQTMHHTLAWTIDIEGYQRANNFGCAAIFKKYIVHFFFHMYSRFHCYYRNPGVVEGFQYTNRLTYKVPFYVIVVRMYFKRQDCSVHCLLSD